MGNGWLLYITNYLFRNLVVSRHRREPNRAEDEQKSPLKALIEILEGFCFRSVPPGGSLSPACHVEQKTRVTWAATNIVGSSVTCRVSIDHYHLVFLHHFPLDMTEEVTVLLIGSSIVDARFSQCCFNGNV